MSAPPVTMYVTGWCPYCDRARRLLAQRQLEVREIDIDENAGSRAEMLARSGQCTVPQIFIGERHIGGSDDLAALADSGELDRIIQGV